MLAPLARITLGVALLVDVLRIFLPSLITIVGSAGSTPPELIGAYALGWFLAAFLAVAAGTVVRPGVVGVVGALLLVAGRVGLQFTEGGPAQLWAASVALLGGLSWLVATAMAPPRDAVRGIVWGLALAGALHAALDTVDLAWRDGPMPLTVLAVWVLAFVATLFRRTPGGPAVVAGVRAELLSVAFLAVGPALLLWGLYAGNVAHAQATAGVRPEIASIAVVVAGVGAALLATAPRRLTGHPVLPGLALIGSAVAFALGSATVDGVHGVAPWWTVLTQVVGALALGACLGWVASGRSGADRPARRGLALAAGFLLFVVFAFAYYAAYDLGLPNDYVPIVVAVLVAVLAVVGSRAGATVRVGESLGARVVAGEPVRLGPTVAKALAGAVVAAVAVAVVPLWRPAPQPPTPPAEGLRVASYNIRMGFGLAGTLTLEQQSTVLRGLGAQVIALSEVDRGWFLNGGHDDLRLIAQRLGMRFIWAPAADEVWGDALLTNLPVVSVRNHPLVAGGPTGAQALEVTLDWAGRPVTVIATHLQPPADWQPLDQVRQLAALVQAAPKPTVVLGDLNLAPGSPAWQVLAGAGLSDAFAAYRPFVTTPSPQPAEEIDHILTTPGFHYDDPAHPDVPYSDHRPVAITLLP